MRLIKARVQNYRSIRDSGWFDIELGKTILVGPNEAGKTALLQAIQQLNAPPEIRKLEPLRDYPRADYNDITTGKVKPENQIVVEGHFALDAEEKEELPEEFSNCTYCIERRLDNTLRDWIKGGTELPKFGDIKKDLARLCVHIDGRIPLDDSGKPTKPLPSLALEEIKKNWIDSTLLSTDNAKSLNTWLQGVLQYIDEANTTEDDRYSKLITLCEIAETRNNALKFLHSRIPVFVLFSNYFRVRPNIHLGHLASRIESKLLDDDQYDYGNQCLLKLLGFTAAELSKLGKAPDPAATDAAALKQYRDQLDSRSYQLNAASVRLTEHICSVWLPDVKRGEADRLKVVVDGQYLKVVVEDSLGVEIELDQRSEGFQWLVSFFTVFFAEAIDKHKNAILLLDEPGLNLHGLKQRDFRLTISKLAEKNQTLYTTHSPFLVGPDELDLVRVVEMVDRAIGTKVHSDVTSEDPASLLPLQEALGYDLAHSLFSQERNLVLEGLTDYWYIESVAHLLREEKIANLNEKIALVPANTAGKVVYFATILYAHKLKVAALLDSDSAGDQAAKQEVLIHQLGNKSILRTKDAYIGEVATPEIEDLLRWTLVNIAKAELGWDISINAEKQSARPIVDIFSAEIPDFSKYKLAKTFVRWARDHTAKDLAAVEKEQWQSLINNINKALK